ncbi:MAG: ABC transporter permease, partial [Candidatus Omnitrophica bacterium]|nr:ABC transporter permease [Candidatus Omnitrophota bacterium]
MNKLSLIGAVIICGLVIGAIFAPIIAPYDPSFIDVDNAYLRPSCQHLMGTDSLGRDLFSRIIFGSRIALAIGIIAVGISALIGLFLGSIAGYFEGKVSYIIMSFTDIMLCFPTMFLVLAIVAIIGPSILNVMIVIGCTSWMGIARLIRAEILSLKKRDFCACARGLGISELSIITKHLIPNGIGPVLINIVFGIAGAVIAEVGLSFLGLGVQPPTPSWGNILMEGKAAMGYAWWIIFFPGLAIFITVMSF